jgi:hypothetical protein
MIVEIKETNSRVRQITCHLDDLSQQQMEVLSSIQSKLMKFESFREDAEASRGLPNSSDLARS